MKFPRFEDFARASQSDVWRSAAKTICERHKISFHRLLRAAESENIIFLVDEKLVVKIYNPLRNRLEREKLALEIARTTLKIPEIVATGEIENYQYLIQTQIGGELMTRKDWLKLTEREQIFILSQLAEGLKNLHRTDSEKVRFDWQAFLKHQAETCFERQKKCGVNERLLAEIPVYLEKYLELLPQNSKEVFMHGDVHFGNLRLLKTESRWQISGLFDFADSIRGFHEYEFLAVGVLMIQGQGDLQREFFSAYGYESSEINENLRKRLMLLTMFYECSDLRRYALRLAPKAVDYSLFELEKAIWNFC